MIENNEADATLIMTKTCYDWRGCGGNLAQGDGDCTTDNDCSGSLKCTHDVGAYFGYIADWDVCLPENFDYTTCGPSKSDSSKVGCSYGSGIFIDKGSVVIQTSTF